MIETEVITIPHYPYLIVGGGMTADAAARGIRELDATGAIGLIGAEAVADWKTPFRKGVDLVGRLPA